MPIPHNAWSSELYENMTVGELSITGTPIKKWKVNAEGLKKEELDDLLILLTYTAS